MAMVMTKSSRSTLAKIPSEIKKIAICVTIHDAEARHQNFGQVSNAYIRIAKLADEFDTVGEPV